MQRHPLNSTELESTEQNVAKGPHAFPLYTNALTKSRTKVFIAFRANSFR